MITATYSVDELDCKLLLVIPCKHCEKREKELEEINRRKETKRETKTESERERQKGKKRERQEKK